MVTCIGGSYSDVIAEVSNRDTLGGEEVESSELLEQSKRKRVYPSAGVRHLRNYMYKYNYCNICIMPTTLQKQSSFSFPIKQAVGYI